MVNEVLLVTIIWLAVFLCVPLSEIVVPEMKAIVDGDIMGYDSCYDCKWNDDRTKMKCRTCYNYDEFNEPCDRAFDVIKTLNKEGIGKPKVCGTALCGLYGD